MKNLFAIMLLVTAFAVTGCGGAKKEEKATTPAPAANETAPPADPAKTP